MTALTEYLTMAWTVAGTAAALLSLPGTVELFLLTLGASLPKKKKRSASFGNSWRLAAVVPAHNEEASIRACVESLKRAARGDFAVDIVVVADNCDDGTADAARMAGARVLQRNDALLRGKGYALDYAFKTLSAEAFDAFLVVDADSDVDVNFFIEAGGVLRSGADAVQCPYLIRNGAESVRTRLRSVGSRAFNVLRARGRDRLGLSCSLYGNGFGLRRETLDAVPYLASSVVEDLEYHLSLIRAGKRVHFVDDASVYADVPAAGKGAATQRARWEGGRLRMLREKTPGLLVDVLKGRARAIEPLLDLLLLPLGFHVVLLIAAALTPWQPAQTLGIAGLFIVVAHLVVSIGLGGWDIRDFAVLAGAPFYVLWKILMIPRVIRNSRAQSAWVRTERAPEKPVQ